MVKVPDDVEPGRLCLQERFADGCNWVLRQGEVSAYDRVLIMGTGALGQAATMVAKVSGAHPVMVLARRGSSRIPAAIAAGADVIVSGTEEEVVQQVREATDGEMASVILDLTTRDAYDVTRIAMRTAGYRARIVQIAAKTPHDMVGINAQRLIGEEMTIRGANGHDYSDLKMAASLLRRPELEAASRMTLARYKLGNLETALNTPSSEEGAVLTVVEP
jgi:threonine dehydrogenase-like Zn-dependent dehydrogenase